MPDRDTIPGLFVAVEPEAGAWLGSLEHTARAVWGYGLVSGLRQTVLHRDCTFHYVGVISEAERREIR